MKFTFFHNNINVLDLDKSVEFYKKALGLEVTKEFHAPDGSFKLVYLGDGTTPHSLELTWLRDMDRRMISEITNLIWHSMSMTWTLPGTSQRNGLRVFRKPGHGNLFHQ